MLSIDTPITHPQSWLRPFVSNFNANVSLMICSPVRYTSWHKHSTSLNGQRRHSTVAASTTLLSRLTSSICEKELELRHALFVDRDRPSHEKGSHGAVSPLVHWVLGVAITLAWDAYILGVVAISWSKENITIIALAIWSFRNVMKQHHSMMR